MRETYYHYSISIVTARFMTFLKHLLIANFLVASVFVQQAAAISIPKGERTFYLATDEIVRKYEVIGHFHSERVTRRAKLSVNNLSKVWGAPTEIKHNHGNLYGSLFLGASSLLLTLPNPLLAIGVATGISSLSYWRTQEVMVWDKGDYLIEVNTRKSNQSSLVSSWIWKYKALDRAVPILGNARKPKNYFTVGYGRGLGSLLKGDASYGNGQYFLLARRVVGISNYAFYLESGASWGLPGKSTPESAQWVRIPVNLAIKSNIDALGFSYGIGAGYEFYKEFSSLSQGSETLRDAKSLFAFVEYRFSSQLSFGIRDNMQWIDRDDISTTIAANQLSSYASIRF